MIEIQFTHLIWRSVYLINKWSVYIDQCFFNLPTPSVYDCNHSLESYQSNHFKFMLTSMPSTLSPSNNLLSAKFLVCSNLQSSSKSLKVSENVVRVSNSLDPGEMPSYLASHLDRSCLHYGTLVLIGKLRVNKYA